MRKVFVVLCTGLLIALFSFGWALADNGPHGGYTDPTSDACAGCHRAHTAQGPKLLFSSSTTALCESCHGPSGTGADTNVWDGIYQDDDATPGEGEGFSGRGLLAGGFVNAVMDTNLDNASVSQGSTSYHNYDGTAGTVWGSGAIDSGVGINLPLNCGNCHNPHGGAGSGGNPTYRILRPIPTGAGGSGYEIGDESEKDYTVDDANGRYFEQNYGGLEFDIGSWCSQCHIRYEAPADSANTASGDPIYMYRHTSDGDNGLSCMDCHVAHGTSASMGPNSGAVAWPDGTTTPGGNERSSLLRIDNRGLCISCHQNP